MVTMDISALREQPDLALILEALGGGGSVCRWVTISFTSGSIHVFEGKKEWVRPVISQAKLTLFLVPQLRKNYRIKL